MINYYLVSYIGFNYYLRFNNNYVTCDSQNHNFIRNFVKWTENQNFILTTHFQIWDYPFEFRTTRFGWYYPLGYTLCNALNIQE